MFLGLYSYMNFRSSFYWHGGIHNSIMNMHNSQMDSNIWFMHPVQHMPVLGIHDYALHTSQII